MPPMFAAVIVGWGRLLFVGTLTPVSRVRQVGSEGPDGLEGLVVMEGTQGSVRLGSSDAEAVQQ